MLLFDISAVNNASSTALSTVLYTASDSAICNQAMSIHKIKFSFEK